MHSLLLLTSLISSCITTKDGKTRQPEAGEPLICQVNCPELPVYAGGAPFFGSGAPKNRAGPVGTTKDAVGIILYKSTPWDDGGGEFRLAAFRPDIDRCPRVESVRIAGGALVIYSERLCAMHVGPRIVDLSSTSFVEIFDVEWKNEAQGRNLPFLSLGIRYREGSTDVQQATACEVHKLMGASLSLDCL